MNSETMTITRKIRNAYNNLAGKLLTKGDFEAKILELKKAKPSGRPMILRQLFDMFKRLDIAYEENQDNKYYENIVENANLPSVKDVEAEMVNILYSIVDVYRKPETYMLEIVNKLSKDKDWEQETLRLRILKQFIKYGDYLLGMFEIKTDSSGRQTEKKLFGGKTEIQKYIKDKIGRKPTDEEVLQYLDDGIFDVYEEAVKEKKRETAEEMKKEISEFVTKVLFKLIKFSKEEKEKILSAECYGDIKKVRQIVNGKWEELEKLIEKLETCDSEKCDKIINKIVKQLSENFFLSKAETEELNKILQKTKSDNYKKSSRKALIKCLKKIKSSQSEGFENLKKSNENKKDSVKSFSKLSGKFGLIKMCNDIAKGNFRSGGSTKQILYLFAMVYDMTFYSGNGDEIIDYETDIEKNLFEDYYNNNMTRFLQGNGEDSFGEYELDPSGQGINYKNFAEMIYIYYISRTEYTPQEKIRLSYEMIKRVRNSEKNDSDNSRDTIEYKDLFAEDIISKSEEEFEDFILKNYNCRTEQEGKENKKGDLQISISQKTAFKIYKELIEEIERTEYDIRNCNYGLMFIDVNAYESNPSEDFGFRKGKDVKKFNDFIKLCASINHFIGINAKEEKSKEKTGAREHEEQSVRKINILNITDDTKVTRLAIITAYYYYYNERLQSSDAKKSLLDIHRDYVNELNPMLTRAGYKELNIRNVFDMYMIFSSYAYLCI